jgi:hypothetical protein
MPLRLPRPAALAARTFSPTDFSLFAGLSVPDPITFVVGRKWLNRPSIYPRQATLLKVIFLREDLFTEYDYQVVDEWEASFRASGENGINPDILVRMRLLRAEGYSYFKEVLLVMGRRAGKGYVCALAMAYVLWRYMAKGDPQDFYAIARDKKLACFVFAAKKDHAIKNLWGDLAGVIKSGPCFRKYISRALGETLTIYAPHDFLVIQEQRKSGFIDSSDQATFIIEPKESTLLSGRGPASFCLDPETPILTADLRWVPIGTLQAGDELVGFDEHPERPGAQRKMRRTSVVRTWRVRKPAKRIVFTDGTSVTCSAEHRWLIKGKGPGGTYRWTTTDRLGPGSFIRHLVDPWEEDRTWEGGYLAGIYDGEGCVSGWSGRAGREVFFSQNGGEVLDYTLKLLRGKGFHPQHYTNSSKNCQQWALGGMNDSMAFLGSIRPQRLMTKSASVWEGVAPRGGLTPSGAQRKDAFKAIVSIEELPAQELVDIETTAHTFIANGLFSHNCQGYDEMAHQVAATGAARSAEEIYGAATPALDQFKKDAFIVEPSSPWQMVGQFYENWLKTQEVDEDGAPLYPYMMMIQLASWEIYYDWEDAHLLPLFPANFFGDLQEYVDRPPPGFRRLKLAIQEYDREMELKEKANPETFAVERRSRWQTTQDAYLNPANVDAIFQPWNGRVLTMRTTAQSLTLFYKGHADPSLANANFAISIGHKEVDEHGFIHCVFDYIHHYSPSDFPKNTIDYIKVGKDIWGLIEGFKPDEFTYDQWNSAEAIQRLNLKAAEANFPKNVMIYEKTADAKHNWERAEAFKVAINQGWVHAPQYDLAVLELKYLQLKNGNKVVKQDAGPVQTKDVADTMMEVVWTIIGEQAYQWTHGALSTLAPSGSVAGGFDPYSQERNGYQEEAMAKMAAAGRRGSPYQQAARAGHLDPSRSPFGSRRGPRHRS